MGPTDSNLDDEHWQLSRPTSPRAGPSWANWEGFADFSLAPRSLRAKLSLSPENANWYERARACGVGEAHHLQCPPSLTAPTPTQKGKSLGKSFGKRVDVPNEHNLFVHAPMEIKEMIIQHIDPLDRIMLKFSCRKLYNTIPLASTFPFPKHSCGKARLFMRLFNSSLLPKFYQKEDLLGKSQMKIVLRNFSDLSHCSMCDTFWLVNSSVQCPFHYQMNTEPKDTLIELLRSKADIRTLMQHVSHSKVVSEEQYIKFMERRAASIPISYLRSLRFDFLKSWANQISEWEDSGLYDPEGKPSIWTLFCCNHCKNVLPSNTYFSKCDHCKCEMCGWTPIRVLRVEGDFDKQPRFIPLGHLRENTRMSDLRILRGPKITDSGLPDELK